MSQDVFEMLRQMDLKNIELQLALQCAPVLADLKVSNLFIISVEEMKQLERLLKHSEICFCLISECENKATVLLYRKEGLEQYIAQEDVVTLLTNFDYNCFSMDALLERFSKRYEAYQKQGGDFPHEMGLFLGYPVEDVVGFMENEGKNCLYTGYWKVYANLQQKLQLFQQFELAKEILIQYVSEGGSFGKKRNISKIQRRLKILA